MIRKVLRAITGHGYVVEIVGPSGNVAIREAKWAETSLRAKSNRYEKMGETGLQWIPIDGDEYETIRAGYTKKVAA